MANFTQYFSTLPVELRNALNKELQSDDMVDARYPYAATVNPAVSNDSLDTAQLGRIFQVGDLWVNTSSQEMFFCVNATPGAAVWKVVETAISATDWDLTFSGICPSGVLVNDSVYITGGKTGNAWNVDQAVITDVEKFPVAIVIAKPTPTTCTLQVYGEIGGFTGLTPNMPVYFGTGVGARLTQTPPTPTSVEIFLKQAGVANDSTFVFFAPKEMYCLVP